MQQIILKASACGGRLRKELLKRTRRLYSYVKIKITVAGRWSKTAKSEFVEWFTEYFERKTFATSSRYPTIYKVIHIFFAISIVFASIQLMMWFYKMVPPLVSNTYQSAIIDKATQESTPCQTTE